MDKWLWCARFFKTRSVAAQAVSGGKVHINGDRVKAAHLVRMGDRISLMMNGALAEFDVLRACPRAAGPRPRRRRPTRKRRRAWSGVRKFGRLSGLADLSRPRT